VIERRGRSLDTGLDRLSRAVADNWNLSVRELTSELMRAAQDDGDPDDDMAVIAVRSAGTGRLLHLQALRADPQLLAGMREQLRAWLATLSLPRDQCEEMVLAVNEAASNALDHGSDMDARRVVTLEAAVRGSELLLCVSDSGRWRPNSPGSSSTRGYGHKLMEALMDGLQTNSDRYGTTVTLSRRMDAIGA
jgi:anti-sigma regulatory factor (Ser/Thr protein kinase)